MPIYEFICRACGNEYEELMLKPSDAPHCPKCGSGDAEKLLSSFRSRSGGDGAGSGGGSSCGGCTASSCAGCGVSS
ncbi:MAG: zinc ribbon domain-containing protein [Deltaproteobacteria bacterium]|jgi:putative FmdB family regulatory protein|nr:zinc ribbon domain-containing protein [Deltaproteobacteria bacterium]